VSQLNVDANPEIIDELRPGVVIRTVWRAATPRRWLPDLYRQIIDSTGTVGGGSG
jgi:hypothetical protein